MNVEVQVVRYRRVTYLVRGARSLEDAERKALNGEARKISESDSQVEIEWSEPVLRRRHENK